MTEPRRPAEDPDRRRQPRPRPSRGANRPGSRPGSARSHSTRAKSVRSHGSQGARSGPARSGAVRRPPRRGGRHEPARRNQLTGRAAVLLLVCCGLALALAYPAREYFAQRAEIERLRQQTDAQLQRVRQLEAEKRRWDDPAYVRAQARERLHYAMPGETPYIAIGPNLRGTDDAPGTSPASGGRAQAWYQRLWQSVQGAADPPAPSGTAVPPAPDDRR